MAAEDKFMQFNSVQADMLLLYFPSLLFAFVRSSSAFASLTLRSIWVEVPLSVPGAGLLQMEYGVAMVLGWLMGSGGAEGQAPFALLENYQRVRRHAAEKSLT